MTSKVGSDGTIDIAEACRKGIKSACAISTDVQKIYRETIFSILKEVSMKFSFFTNLPLMFQLVDEPNRPILKLRNGTKGEVTIKNTDGYKEMISTSSVFRNNVHDIFRRCSGSIVQGDSRHASRVYEPPSTVCRSDYVSLLLFPAAFSIV